MLALLLLLPLALNEVIAPLADAAAIQVRVTAADRRLAGLASLEPAVTDPARPLALPAPGPGAAVRVRGVTAGWGSVPGVTDLDLDLTPGTRVAVVGPSGSGKSTLAAALLRFIDPTAGSLDLDGVPLTSLRLDDVRGRVGLVDDDPHVFASTVLENVRLARPTATAAQVEAALRAVHLGPWLEQLPRGLSTLLGDGYTSLSGGERARLGMARAVLADLPALVLDEPTAHLDTATAEAVAADLLDSSAGRSVVWITHGSIGLDRVDKVVDLGAARRTAAA
jgi:ATP-binding cassette subfamily C protein CydCD